MSIARRRWLAGRDRRAAAKPYLRLASARRGILFGGKLLLAELADPDLPCRHGLCLAACQADPDGAGQRSRPSAPVWNRSRSRSADRTTTEAGACEERDVVAAADLLMAGRVPWRFARRDRTSTDVGIAAAPGRTPALSESAILAAVCVAVALAGCSNPDAHPPPGPHKSVQSPGDPAPPPPSAGAPPAGVQASPPVVAGRLPH